MAVPEKLMDSLDDVKFVRLPDTRKIAYRELGCDLHTSKRAILVLHGLGSSRLAAMPGVSHDLLIEFGVRLVSIDRPGYGRSDCHARQTLKSVAKDLERVIDELNLKNVWLLGFSGGGAYCWAAARYIPQRLHGIALWAPIGNYWWKGISEGERRAMFSSLTDQSKKMFPLARRMPGYVLHFYVRMVLVRRMGAKWVEHCRSTLLAPDKEHLEQERARSGMLRDNIESLKLNKGYGMAKDLKLFTSKWGFELEDIAREFRGKRIHIWQGDQDPLVPLALQQWIQSKIPEVVQLHELQNEGHISWFCYNDLAHRQVFETLFHDNAMKDQCKFPGPTI